MFPRCTLPFSSLLLMKVSTGLRTAVLIIPYAAGNRKHLRKFRWFFCRRVYVIHSAHTSSPFTWLPFWLPSSPNFGSQPHSNGKNPSVFIIKNPIKNPRKPCTSGGFSPVRPAGVEPVTFRVGENCGICSSFVFPAARCCAKLWKSRVSEWTLFSCISLRGIPFSLVLRPPISRKLAGGCSTIHHLMNSANWRIEVLTHTWQYHDKHNYGNPAQRKSSKKVRKEV